MTSIAPLSRPVVPNRDRDIDTGLRMPRLAPVVLGYGVAGAASLAIWGAGLAILARAFG